MKHTKSVRLFMNLSNQSVSSDPTLSDYKIRKLRASLILEEAQELIKALGFNIEETSKDRLTLIHSGVQSLNEIVDGLADLRVICTGTALALGVNMKPFQKIVDLNNLEKLTGDYSVREDGKILKSSKHVPPTKLIDAELKNQQGV